jgi:hypothetical protein
MNLSADLFERSDARFIRLCLPISEIIPLLEKTRLFVNHRYLFTHRDIVTWGRKKGVVQGFGKAYPRNPMFFPVNVPERRISDESMWMQTPIYFSSSIRPTGKGCVPKNESHLRRKDKPALKSCSFETQEIVGII